MNHVREEKKTLVIPGFKKSTSDSGVTHVSAFICRCGEENTAYADVLQAEVKEDIRKIYPTLTDGDFLTVVVQELNWQHNAHISGIYNDQWSMVCAETHDEKFKVTIQCDRAEDGIAAVWKAFRDHGTPVEDES